MRLKCNICGFEGDEVEVDDHMIREHTEILEE